MMFAKGPAVFVLSLGAMLAVVAGQVRTSPAEQHGGARAHAEPDDPRVLFEQRCVACHVGPDLAFATDRAWVEQVRGTA